MERGEPQQAYDYYGTEADDRARDEGEAQNELGEVLEHAAKTRRKARQDESGDNCESAVSSSRSPAIRREQWPSIRRENRKTGKTLSALQDERTAEEISLLRLFIGRFLLRRLYMLRWLAGFWPAQQGVASSLARPCLVLFPSNLSLALPLFLRDPLFHRPHKEIQVYDWPHGWLPLEPVLVWEETGGQSLPDAAPRPQAI